MNIRITFHNQAGTRGRVDFIDGKLKSRLFIDGPKRRLFRSIESEGKGWNRVSPGSELYALLTNAIDEALSNGLNGVTRLVDVVSGKSG